MRTIGIDLAITAPHKAVVVDAEGNAVSPLLSFRTSWGDIQQLVATARDGVAPDHPLQAIMEPTGSAWYPMSVSLRRLRLEVYMVCGQRVFALSKFYQRHGSSDRASARVLAKIPLVDKESLYPLTLPDSARLACQRGCREMIRMQEELVAIKNRLRSIDRFAWPGLELILKDIYGRQARWLRQQWYDPAQVVVTSLTEIEHSFRSVIGEKAQLDWLASFRELAQQVVALYGSDAIDYTCLQQELTREQEQMSHLERRVKDVWQQVVQPLYHQLHPQRHLETIWGVGEQSAAIYVSFIGPADRFPSLRHFRGWHGMIPNSRQSGASEGKGLRISKAGPDPIKRFSYLNAEVARRYDPQIAAIYYDQIVNKGKHHRQAICACATHLLDRVYTILKENRPYELREADGNPA
jgi:transposase